MEAKERIVLTYVKADGSAPFNDWLEALKDRKARAIIRTRINRVRLVDILPRPTRAGILGSNSNWKLNFSYVA